MRGVHPTRALRSRAARLDHGLTRRAWVATIVRKGQMQDDSQPATAEHAYPERIAERFLVQQLLGSGASGVVYQVVDEHSGAKLALKLLSAHDPVSLFNFKSEFRTLANLSHRHLLKLYDLLTHGDQWLLTMELVDGTDFLSYVRPGLQGPHKPSGNRSGTASEPETKYEVDEDT